MGTLLGDALAKAGLVSQKKADQIEHKLRMEQAAKEAEKPPEEPEYKIVDGIAYQFHKGIGWLRMGSMEALKKINLDEG